MGFNDEIPLFVETNIGTHFALSVSRDITAGDLKGKLGMEHFSCFPNLGKIKVHGLMMKKKSFLYRLSDSMAIKHVFKELSGYWLLRLDACQKPVNLDVAEPVEATKWTKNVEVRLTSGSSFSTDHQLKPDCGKAIHNDINSVSEHENLSILEKSGNSQTISVTGIISRFFSELDEADSSYCQPKHSHGTVMQAENTAERAELALKIKKQQIGSRKQINKNSICKHQVGKRVVQAANGIAISGNGKRPVTKFLSKFKELTSSDSALFDRKIEFDATDDFAD